MSATADPGDLDLAKAIDSPAQPVPHLILLAVELPDMNGFDLLEELRQHPRLGVGPVMKIVVAVMDIKVAPGLRCNIRRRTASRAPASGRLPPPSRYGDQPTYRANAIYRCRPEAVVQV